MKSLDFKNKKKENKKILHRFFFIIFNFYKKLKFFIKVNRGGLKINNFQSPNQFFYFYEIFKISKSRLIYIYILIIYI
jgi:hypothetical protein